MKRLVIIIAALSLAFGANAQIGSLIGGAVKKGIQKKVEQKVDEALGVKNNQQQSDNPTSQPQEQAKEESDHVPTPEEVMAMLPKLPTTQNVAEYLCEQSRESPRMLKLATNPTTLFLTNMGIAMANGYVTMMAGNGNGSYLALDEQLRNELGIDEEKYEAMSEEEQQELARKYAAEIEKRQLSTAEKLASDKKYTSIMEQYTAIEDEIGRTMAEADTACAKLWREKYAATGDKCAYYREAVPLRYKAVLQCMEIRKMRQLPVAKQADDRIVELTKQYPAEVFSGFVCNGGVCATAYLTDAALMTTIDR